MLPGTWTHIPREYQFFLVLCDWNLSGINCLRFFPRKWIRRVQWYLVPGGVTVTQSAHTILSEYGNPLHSFTAGSAVESDGLQQGKHRVNGFTFKTMLSCAQVLETFLFLLLNENLTSVTMRRLVCSSTHSKQQARRQGIFQALMEAVWQNK